MSYRKITVDGKEYEYVVGKTHVKVKGVGAWQKEQVGFVIDERTTQVQPSHIVDKIRHSVSA